MLFKRKKELTKLEKLKNFIHPKKGLIRAYKYLLKRLFRLKGDIHSVALGAAFGLSIAITPLFGLQLILTVVFDFIFQANLTASMLFTIVGNPLTFPFIWFADYKLGNIFLSNDTIDSASFSNIIIEIKNAFSNSNWEVMGNYITSILYPMLLGGIIIAILSGIITYKFVFKSLTEYKEMKLKKIKKRMSK